MTPPRPVEVGRAVGEGKTSTRADDADDVAKKNAAREEGARDGGHNHGDHGKERDEKRDDERDGDSDDSNGGDASPSARSRARRAGPRRVINARDMEDVLSGTHGLVDLASSSSKPKTGGARCC